MSGGTPYIGSKISLVSKAKIRYEGYLYTIDTKESTVTLAKVQSFGTEERQTQNPVPSRDEIYEYIVFRGSDIDDLHVCEGPKSRQAPHDPAIVQTGSAQPPSMYPPMQQQISSSFHHQGYGPFGGMPPFEYPFGFRPPTSMPVQIPPSMSGSGSLERVTKTPPSLDRISNQSSSPPLTTTGSGTKIPPKETMSRSPPPEKPRPTKSERNTTPKYCEESREKPRSSELFDRSHRSEKSIRSNQYEKSDSDRFNRYEESDHSDRYKKSDRVYRNEKLDCPDRYEKSDRADRYEKSDRADRYEKSDRADRYEKSDRADRYEKSDRADRYAKSDRADRYEKSDRADRYEKSDRADRYEKSDRSRPTKKTRPTSQERQRRGSGSGPPRARGRGRGTSRGGGRRSPYNHRNKQGFDEEFDFESANAKFNKEEIEKELLKTLKKNLAIKDDDDVIVENDTSKASLDGNEENEDEDGLISPDKYYDYSKSFFDSISCESFERGSQVTTENNSGDSPFNRSSGRITRRQERALNIETFGYPQHGYRGRGRGRGRGRPYRGRGGRGRGPSRGFRGRGNLSGSNRAWVDYEFDYEAAGINQKTGATATVGGS